MSNFYQSKMSQSDRSKIVADEASTSRSDSHSVPSLGCGFYDESDFAHMKSGSVRHSTDKPLKFNPLCAMDSGKDSVSYVSGPLLDSGLDSGMDQLPSFLQSEECINLAKEPGTLTARGCISSSSTRYTVVDKFESLSLEPQDSKQYDSLLSSGVSTEFSKELNVLSLPYKESLHASGDMKDDLYGSTASTKTDEEEFLHWDSPVYWPPYFHADEDGDTDLHIAIIHQCPEAFDMIQAATSDTCLNVQNRQYHQTPLHLSVLMKQAAVTRLLLVWGAALDLRDHRGDTPLHIACRNGDMDCVRALTVPLCYSEIQFVPYDVPLQKVPQEPDVVNYEGESSLHLASSAHHKEILWYLVEKCDADVNKQETKAGRTILHQAVLANDFPWVKVLVTLPHIDLEAVTFSGKTSLDTAQDCGFQEIALLLQSCGAQVGEMDFEDYLMDDSDEEPFGYDDLSICGKPLVEASS